MSKKKASAREEPTTVPAAASASRQLSTGNGGSNRSCSQSEQDSHTFANKIREFHNSKKTPFLRAPVALGRRVDFLQLYNIVGSMGGYRKVNESEEWATVLESIGIKQYCVNAELAVKQIYQRYLEPYERQLAANEDKDLSGYLRIGDESSDDSELARYKRSQNIEQLSFTYNSQCHTVAPHMREQWNLSCELVEICEFFALEKSLLSGLPNEIDFAINTCLLMSHQPGAIQLRSNSRLIELLAAHAGIVDCGAKSYYPLMEEWKKQNKTNMLRFWFESVWDSELRQLIKPDSLTDNCDSRVKIEDPNLHWRLLNLTPDLSLRDSEGQRIVLIITTIRNLVLDDRENAAVVSRSPPALRFLLLCLASRHSMLQHLALDSLVALPLVLHSNKLAKAVLAALLRCFNSQDRQLIVRGLELLTCLSGQLENATFLSDELPDSIYDSLTSWLLLKDLQLLLTALETIFRLSGLGGVCAARLCATCDLLRVLLSLLTFEASQVGGEGILGIKIFQGNSGHPDLVGQPPPGMLPHLGVPHPGIPHPGMPHPGIPHPGMPHPGIPHPGMPHPGVPHSGMPPPPPPPPGKTAPQQLALVKPAGDHQTLRAHGRQSPPPPPPPATVPPNDLRDYALWWLRTRQLPPNCHPADLYSDCARSFARQFNGYPFLPPQEFYSLLRDIGYPASHSNTSPLPAEVKLCKAPPPTKLQLPPVQSQQQQKPLVPKAPPPRPPTPPLTPPSCSNSVDSADTQGSSEHQHQRKRRHSSSSSSAGTDAGKSRRLYTADEPQMHSERTQQPGGQSDAPVGHEAVIERVLNCCTDRLLKGEKSAGKLPNGGINGHGDSPSAVNGLVPNGCLSPSASENSLTQQPTLRQRRTDAEDSSKSGEELPDNRQQRKGEEDEAEEEEEEEKEDEEDEDEEEEEEEEAEQKERRPTRQSRHSQHQRQHQPTRRTPSRAAKSVKLSAPVNSLPNGHAGRDEQQQQQQQQQAPLGLACEWDGCWQCWETPARVLHHVYTEHLANSGAERCLWRGCDPGRRGQFSLLAHVQERHCSEESLRSSLHRRRAAALAVAGADFEQPPTPMTRLPECAAEQAIRRAASAATREPPAGREGPVTKHIRLTAALALRNLVHNAQAAKDFAAAHVSQLADIGLAGGEAAQAAYQCISELA